MKIYPLGGVPPRFFAIGSATFTTPVVVTTTQPHGFQLTDVITISQVGVNTAANGTYASGAFSLTPTTITLLGVVGNGIGSGGIASAPRQVINASTFPVIPGVTDNTKLLVTRMLFLPGPHGLASLFIGAAGLNQATLANVMRAVNPPPAQGIYDSYDIDAAGENVIPIADYWVDAANASTEGCMVTFWIS